MFKYIASLQNKRVVNNLIFTLALLAFMLPLSLRKISANDIWKALYTGRYIAQNFAFPHHSVFTFSPVKGELGRHSFTWLGNLFFLGLHRLGGGLALQFFRLLLLTGCLFLLYSMFDYLNHPALLLLLVAGGFGLIQKLLLRNAIFLIPGVIILFWFWQQARVNRYLKFLWGIPILLVSWSNIHGSYLVGVGMFGLLVVGDLIDWTWRRAERLKGKWYLLLVVVFVISLLAVTYIKPGGPDYKTFRIFIRAGNFGLGGILTGPGKNESTNYSVQNLSDKIQLMLQSTVFGNVYKNELRSTEFSFPLNRPDKLDVSVSLGLIGIFFGALIASLGNVRFAELLPFAAATLIGLGYLRTVALIPLTLLSLLAVKYSWGDFQKYSLGFSVRLAAIVVLGLLGVNLIYCVSYDQLGKFTGNYYYQYGTGLHARLSRNTANYVLSAHPEEKFYNHYNLGSWLIWLWWPRKRVFYDTKGSAYTREFRRTVHSTPPAEYMRDHGFRYGLFPLRSRWVYKYFIPHPEWEIISLDLGMIAFKRRTVVRPAKSVDLADIRVNQQRLDEVSSTSRRYFFDVLKFIGKFSNRRAMVGKVESPRGYFDYSQKAGK